MEELDDDRCSGQAPELEVHFITRFTAVFAEAKKSQSRRQAELKRRSPSIDENEVMEGDLAEGGACGT